MGPVFEVTAKILSPEPEPRSLKPRQDLEDRARFGRVERRRVCLAHLLATSIQFLQPLSGVIQKEETRLRTGLDCLIYLALTILHVPHSALTVL